MSATDSIPATGPIAASLLAANTDAFKAWATAVKLNPVVVAGQALPKVLQEVYDKSLTLPVWIRNDNVRVSEAYHCKSYEYCNSQGAFPYSNCREEHIPMMNQLRARLIDSQRHCRH
jgi:hypothetical protein